MSTSVCVCLSASPRTYLPIRTRDHYQIFMRVAHHRGSVLLRRGDESPRGRDNLGVLFSGIQHIIWDPYKTAGPMKMPFGLMTRVDPRYHVLDGDPIPQGEGAIFWGKRSGPL